MADLSNIPTDQLLQMLNGGQGQGQPQQQPSADDVARQAGIAHGEGESALTAGISQAARQATFGGQNYVNAGARYLAQHLTGEHNPDSFNSDLAYSRGISEGELQAHPVASTAGGAAGAVMAGGAAGTALKGSRFASALAGQPGQKVANVLKAGALSGTVGGATALAQGDSAPDAARTAAISGVAGPVVGKVASKVLAFAQPVSTKAMQTLADTIHETPQALQSAYQAFQTLTGRVPSMAELMGLKSQGKLRDLAKVNPTISEAAMTAADLGGQPLHEQLGALNAQGASRPQTAQTLTEDRDATMDRLMNTPHPQTGVTLNDTPVRDPQGLMLDPRVEMALRPNNVLNARLGNLNMQGQPPIMERIQNDQATIGDVEQVRKSLRDMQSQLMRPGPGSLHSRDPLLAKEFGDLAQKVEGLGSRTDKDYGVALNNYRGQSQYIDAFQHGLKGKAINDVPAGDSMLAKSLQSAAGQQGYQHGNALNTAQQALNSIAPGSVNQPTDAFGARHAAQLMAATTTGGPNTVIHFLRGLPVVGDRIPDKVQQVIAKQLFNPKTTQQGINNLTRAGVAAKDLRVLSASIGGVAGQKIADYLSQKGQ